MDRQFHQLHREGLLILTNVAVATSSAAVARAHGYADGNALLQMAGSA